MSRPGAPPPGSQDQQPLSFKTVPGRNRTQKWQQAKTYNYDGDEWGGYDPYDEYGGPVDEEPMPQAVPRTQRVNSFERGDEKRQFSAGVPEGASDVQPSPGHARRFTNPDQVPLPLNTQTSPQLATVTPTSPLAAVKSTPDKPLPFIRPSDIYKRMEEERERERQSVESSRPSLDSLHRGAASSPPHEPAIKSSPAAVAERQETTPGQSVLPDLSAGKIHPSPGSDAMLQHQPSVGIRSAVNHAFDRADDSSVPPTPSSQNVSRSDTTSTAGISPIMSRVPSGAAANHPDHPRQPQITPIAEEPTSARTPTTSNPLTIIPGGNVAVKPGYRRSLDPPSLDNSPARTPTLEDTANRRLSGPLSANLQSPEVDDQAAGLPSAQLHTTSSADSTIDEYAKALASSTRSRSGTNYSLREADLAQAVSASPENATSSPIAAAAEAATRSEFLRLHPDQSNAPKALPNEVSASSLESGRSSPTKGRVREIADKFHDLDSASRRGSQASLGSRKSSWSNFASDAESPKKESAPFGARSNRPVDGENPSSFDAPKPRPQMPGAWESLQPTPQGEAPPSLSLRPTFNTEDSEVDLAPTTQKTQLQSSGTARSGLANPLGSLKEAGAALGASLMATTGLASQSHDFANPQSKTEAEPSPVQDRAPTGEISSTSHPPLNRVDSEFTSGSQYSASNSIPPTPVNDHPVKSYLPFPGTAASRVPPQSSLTVGDADDAESDRLSREIELSLNAREQPIEAELPSQPLSTTGATRPYLQQRFSWEEPLTPLPVVKASEHTAPKLPTIQAPDPIPDVLPEMPYEKPRTRGLHIVNPSDGGDVLDSPATPQQPPPSNFEPVAAGKEEHGPVSPVSVLKPRTSLSEAPMSPISDVSAIGTFGNDAKVPEYDVAPETADAVEAEVKSPRSSGQRIPPFREILAIKSTPDRIGAYNDTRDSFATMDTGLTNWLSGMLAQHPEHANLSLGPVPRTDSTGATISGRHKHSPSIMKFAGVSNRRASLGASDAIESTPSKAGQSKDGDNEFRAVDLDKMQQRGKDLLKNASVFGGKAQAGAKGLFAKGKSRFGAKRDGGGDGKAVFASSKLNFSSSRQKQSSTPSIAGPSHLLSDNEQTGSADQSGTVIPVAPEIITDASQDENRDSKPAGSDITSSTIRAQTSRPHLLRSKTANSSSLSVPLAARTRSPTPAAGSASRSSSHGRSLSQTLSRLSRSISQSTSRTKSRTTSFILLDPDPTKTELELPAPESAVQSPNGNSGAGLSSNRHTPVPIAIPGPRRTETWDQTEPESFASPEQATNSGDFLNSRLGVLPSPSNQSFLQHWNRDDLSSAHGSELHDWTRRPTSRALSSAGAQQYGDPKLAKRLSMPIAPTASDLISRPVQHRRRTSDLATLPSQRRAMSLNPQTPGLPTDFAEQIATKKRELASSNNDQGDEHNLAESSDMPADHQLLTTSKQDDLQLQQPITENIVGAQSAKDVGNNAGIEKSLGLQKSIYDGWESLSQISAVDEPHVTETDVPTSALTECHSRRSSVSSLGSQARAALEESEAALATGRDDCLSHEQSRPSPVLRAQTPPDLPEAAVEPPIRDAQVAPFRSAQEAQPPISAPTPESIPGIHREQSCVVQGFENRPYRWGAARSTMYPMSYAALPRDANGFPVESAIHPQETFAEPAIPADERTEQGATPVHPVMTDHGFHDAPPQDQVAESRSPLAPYQINDLYGLEDVIAAPGPEFITAEARPAPASGQQDKSGRRRSGIWDTIKRRASTFREDETNDHEDYGMPRRKSSMMAAPAPLIAAAVKTPGRSSRGTMKLQKQPPQRATSVAPSSERNSKKRFSGLGSIFTRSSTTAGRVSDPQKFNKLTKTPMLNTKERQQPVATSSAGYQGHVGGYDAFESLRRQQIPDLQAKGGYEDHEAFYHATESPVPQQMPGQGERQQSHVAMPPVRQPTLPHLQENFKNGLQGRITGTHKGQFQNIGSAIEFHAPTLQEAENRDLEARRPAQTSSAMRPDASQIPSNRRFSFANEDVPSPVGDAPFADFDSLPQKPPRTADVNRSPGRTLNLMGTDSHTVDVAAYSSAREYPDQQTPWMIALPDEPQPQSTDQSRQSWAPARQPGYHPVRDMSFDNGYGRTPNDLNRRESWSLVNGAPTHARGTPPDTYQPNQGYYPPSYGPPYGPPTSQQPPRPIKQGPGPTPPYPRGAIPWRNPQHPPVYSSPDWQPRDRGDESRFHRGGSVPQQHRRPSSGYTGRRDEPSVTEEQIIMRGTSYPGQEWMPSRSDRNDY